MRLIAGLVMGLMAGAASAEEWQPMSGAEIADVLTGATLDYGPRWQDFRASGRTLYFSGRESWGYWQVQDDAYCSQWPPSSLWDCYAMTRAGNRVRFIGASGDVTEGVLRD